MPHSEAYRRYVSIFRISDVKLKTNMPKEREKYLKERNGRSRSTNKTVCKKSLSWYRLQELREKCVNKLKWYWVICKARVGGCRLLGREWALFSKISTCPEISPACSKKGRKTTTSWSSCWPWVYYCRFTCVSTTSAPFSKVTDYFWQYIKLHHLMDSIYFLIYFRNFSSLPPRPDRGTTSPFVLVWGVVVKW